MLVDYQVLGPLVVLLLDVAEPTGRTVLLVEVVVLLLDE